MAWFPAPAQPDPAVVEMLEVERDYLLGEWTLGKIVIALLVPVVFGGIALALWRRSIGWALVVINAGVLFKVVWTYFFDAEGAGAAAHLPAALVGLAVVDVVLVLADRLAAAAPRPATATVCPSTGRERCRTRWRRSSRTPRDERGAHGRRRRTSLPRGNATSGTTSATALT